MATINIRHLRFVNATRATILKSMKNYEETNESKKTLTITTRYSNESRSIDFRTNGKNTITAIQPARAHNLINVYYMAEFSYPASEYTAERSTCVFVVTGTFEMVLR